MLLGILHFFCRNTFIVSAVVRGGVCEIGFSVLHPKKTKKISREIKMCRVLLYYYIAEVKAVLWRPQRHKVLRWVKLRCQIFWRLPCLTGNRRLLELAQTTAWIIGYSNQLLCILYRQALWKHQPSPRKNRKRGLRPFRRHRQEQCRRPRFLVQPLHQRLQCFQDQHPRMYHLDRLLRDMCLVTEYLVVVSQHLAMGTDLGTVVGTSGTWCMISQEVWNETELNSAKDKRYTARSPPRPSMLEYTIPNQVWVCRQIISTIPPASFWALLAKTWVCALLLRAASTTPREPLLAAPTKRWRYLSTAITVCQCTTILPLKTRSLWSWSSLRASPSPLDAGCPTKSLRWKPRALSTMFIAQGHLRRALLSPLGLGGSE